MTERDGVTSFDRVRLASGPHDGQVLKVLKSQTARLELQAPAGGLAVYVGDTATGTLHHDQLVEAFGPVTKARAERLQRQTQAKRRRPTRGL